MSKTSCYMVFRLLWCWLSGFPQGRLLQKRRHHRHRRCVQGNIALFSETRSVLGDCLGEPMCCFILRPQDSKPTFVPNRLGSDGPRRHLKTTYHGEASDRVPDVVRGHRPQRGGAQRDKESKESSKVWHITMKWWMHCKWSKQHKKVGVTPERKHRLPTSHMRRRSMPDMSRPHAG